MVVIWVEGTNASTRVKNLPSPQETPSTSRLSDGMNPVYSGGSPKRDLLTLKDGSKGGEVGKKGEWVVEEVDEMLGDGIISFESDDDEEGEDVQSIYENHDHSNQHNYYRGKEQGEEESLTSSSSHNIMNRYYDVFLNTRPTNIHLGTEYEEKKEPEEAEVEEEKEYEEEIDMFYTPIKYMSA